MAGWQSSSAAIWAGANPCSDSSTITAWWPAATGPQVGLELLDLTSWTFRGHADQAHTDHDLVGWADDVGNFDPAPGEADVNALQLPVSRQVLVICQDHGTRALPRPRDHLVAAVSSWGVERDPSS